MSLEWIAVGVASVSLLVSLVTLVVALLILGSVRRSEQAGEERLEILREQRERLAFLHKERRLLLEELENQRKATPEGTRSAPPLEEDDRQAEPRELPETPVERPEGEEVWLDAASSQEDAQRPWWRRMFGG